MCIRYEARSCELLIPAPSVRTKYVRERTFGVNIRTSGVASARHFASFYVYDPDKLVCTYTFK